MSTFAISPPTFEMPPSAPGTPSWPITLLYPLQGQWSEEEYLSVQEKTRQIVELSDGQIDVLPMPIPLHQRIVAFLYLLLRACVDATGSGEVFFAPLPVRLWEGKYRAPDVVYLKPGRILDPRHQPQGADLAIEVVSDTEEDRRRDLVTKRREYAQAGIAEYWIVDPQTETISVLVLEGSVYRLQGEFARGAAASSVLLSNFVVDVAAVFDAGQGPR